MSRLLPKFGVTKRPLLVLFIMLILNIYLLVRYQPTIVIYLVSDIERLDLKWLTSKLLDRELNILKNSDNRFAGSTSYEKRVFDLYIIALHNFYQKGALKNEHILLFDEISIYILNQKFIDERVKSVVVSRLDKITKLDSRDDVTF